MAFVSYAQNCEDVMLWRALSHVEKGFYIDVGACDPVEYSVTKAFYDAGWCGINLEPAASAFEKLQAARWRDVNLPVAAGDTTGELRFFDIAGTGLSTTKEEIAREHASELGLEVVERRVAAQTLTEICEQHEVRDIHFLKIDVEGAEREVLLGLDLERVRPWIVLVEATLPGRAVEHTDAWEELVTARGYHSVWFDGLNRFYVADEHDELDAAFRVPPNVWDRFVTYGESSAADRVAHFESENVDLRARTEEALERLAASESERAGLAQQLAASEADRAERTQAEAHWRGLAHQFSEELRAIHASRSWRLTEPVRWARHTAARITRSPDGQWRSPSGVLSEVFGLGARAARRAVRYGAAALNRIPRIKGAVMSLVRRLPGLETRLRSSLRTQTAPPRRFPEDRATRPDDALPRRAQRLHARLRAARSRTVT